MVLCNFSVALLTIRPAWPLLRVAMMQQHFERQPGRRGFDELIRLTPSGLVDRTHVVIDLENLCGGSDSVSARSAGTYRALAEVVPFHRSQVVVAVGVNAWSQSPMLGFEWPQARFLVGRGINGADLRLVEDLIDEPQAQRSARVVIASGDGLFAEPALRLRSRGISVSVVAVAHSLSRRLREAASEVLYLPHVAA